jgi:two-component system sensor histidine kinase BaeS
VRPGGPQEVADVAVALDALATQLADAEDRQRRFLLAVSHELRTPLTAVPATPRPR